MRIPQEPNRPTCPQINKIQKTLDWRIKDFENFKDTDSVDDFISSMSDACSELWDIYSQLEDLRHSNADLRDWGNELTSCIEQIESQHQSEVDDLYNQISAKENEIENLEEIIVQLSVELL